MSAPAADRAAMRQLARFSRGRRERYGGAVTWVEPPQEWRASTMQACGLYPFAVGGESPMIGVPLGRNLLTGATVCCDPLSWFRPGRIINNPSMFGLGLPGLGKSTLNRRIITGLAAAGVVPVIAGDLKPDYADLVSQLGGTVIRIGRGQGQLNPLDPGTLAEASARLSGDARTALLEEAHGRRVNMVMALVGLVRGAPVTEAERTVLSCAIRLLVERHPDAARPMLADLRRLLEEAPEPVRLAALDRGDRGAYRVLVDPLQRSLVGLIDGELGELFAGRTTAPITLDTTAVCVDVSRIAGHDATLTAAVLLATWNEAYGTVWAANALSDADPQRHPQRHTLVVLDELWRVLSAGPGMVDRINHLGRVNRQEGAAQIMTTHTMADLDALASAADVKKAEGFIERSGIVAMGGLPMRELHRIDRDILRLTDSEKALVSSWHTPETLAGNVAPPGQGNFLLKVANRPGIPVHIDLTETERAAQVHNTDRRWS